MRWLQLIRSLVCMGQYYTIKTPTPLLELWPVISRQTGNSHRTSRTRTIKKFTTRSGYLSFLPHLPSTLQHRTITLLIHSSPSSHSLSILSYRTSTLFFILHSRPSLSLSRLVVSFKPDTHRLTVIVMLIRSSLAKTHKIHPFIQRNRGSSQLIPVSGTLAARLDYRFQHSRLREIFYSGAG